MNPELLKFIRQLSVADKKTLSQKGLKLAEECGELAKDILPYETASGSLHKIVHKNQILENSIDNILVALSIAYSLDYTDEEIVAMMHKKANYWAQIQSGEDKVDSNKIPHEIHITIQGRDGANIDLEDFRAVCSKLGVKPIVLDLHTKEGAEIKDIMTSSISVSSTATAIYKMNELKEQLTKRGYNVVRNKLESVPWHPMVPNRENKFKHTEGCYFESHIEVFIDGSNPLSMPALKGIAANHDLHVSRNFFKRTDSGIFTIMLTLRDYTGTIEDFKQKVSEAREAIKSSFDLTGKEEIEYCLYDSNTDHDNIWIK